MDLQESAENYLETIFILRNRIGAVRSVDIVNELDFTRPSVSVAMKKLRESGHINVDSDGYITLTEIGQKVAEEIYERHSLLSGFLIALGVDKTTAAEDACRIEHIISKQSFEKIQDFVQKEFEKK
ncbi:MAG: metal-dependent transcriptional regulator [Clostridiales bacterium]|nr:metal-dependent transcriptional regulator [Clostridiales bacterium]